jgi:hypothetical protein
MNHLYDYLVFDPETPLFMLLLVLTSIWGIALTVFIGHYFSYKKIKEVDEKTKVINALNMDIHTLERRIEELNSKAFSIERQTELKISMMERVNNSLEEENMKLKFRFESGDNFKDELYRTIVNLVLETRALFWTGALEHKFLVPLMTLGLSPNNDQLETIENLSNLKKAYYKNDIVIRDLIKNGPTKWGALEDGLRRGLPIQEITLVVPTKDVIQMQTDAFIACSKLNQVEIENG